MHIFIYSHTPQNVQQFKKTVVGLGQRGNQIVNQDELKLQLSMHVSIPTVHYEITLRAMKHAKLCIFEISNAHFYDGFFMNLAFSKNIKCIACSTKKESESSVNGCTNPLYYFRHYTDCSDLINQLTIFGI